MKLNNRPKITEEEFGAVMRLIPKHLKNAIQKNGDGIMASSHEILGALQEEFHEFTEAVHRNDSGKQIDELYDIIMICLTGIASIKKEV